MSLIQPHPFLQNHKNGMAVNDLVQSQARHEQRRLRATVSLFLGLFTLLSLASLDVNKMNLLVERTFLQTEVTSFNGTLGRWNAERQRHLVPTTHVTHYYNHHALVNQKNTSNTTITQPLAKSTTVSKKETVKRKQAIGSTQQQRQGPLRATTITTTTNTTTRAIKTTTIQSPARLTPSAVAIHDDDNQRRKFSPTNKVEQ